MISKAENIIALRACARELHEAMTGRPLVTLELHTLSAALSLAESHIQSVAFSTTQQEQSMAMARLKRTYDNYRDPITHTRITPNMARARAVLQKHEMMPTV